MNARQMIEVLCVLVALAVSVPVSAGPFVAYSLREASQRAEAHQADLDVAELGGITRVLGMVQDPATGEIVLVGRRLAGHPALSLEDFVVALRARLGLGEWPTVSIDPTDSTARTGLQKVNFLGGIGPTEVGRKFLASDVFLKRYSLEAVPPVTPMRSYRFLAGEASKAGVVAAGLRTKSLRWGSVNPTDDALATVPGSPVGPETSYQVRFWFYPLRPRVVAREGVFCINEMRLGVDKESFGSPPGGSGSNPALAAAADAFARGVAGNLPALATREPALAWLKGFYDLVAVAEGIRRLPDRPNLSYLLHHFPVRTVENNGDFPLLMVRGLLDRSDGATEAILISGGVSLQTEIQWLNEGDVTPLRDIVLKSRPAPNAVSWTLPLDGWEMPNAQDISAATLKAAARPTLVPVLPGFSLRTQTILIAPTGRAGAETLRSGFSSQGGVPELRVQSPRIDYLDRIGGVVIDTVVDGATFHTDGNLDALRDRILKMHSGPAALAFPPR